MARRVGFGDSADREPHTAQKTTEPSESDRAGWAPYLDDGENLLWVGAPTPGLSVQAADLPKSAFGLFYLGFAIFWTVLASAGAAKGGGLFAMAFPLFGIPFMVVGAYILFGRFFFDAYRRRKTRYALTDRRAIIASSALRRSMTSYPATSFTAIELQEGPPDTINFATRSVRKKRGYRDIPVGFERIKDGAHVHRVLRRIVKDTQAG